MKRSNRFHCLWSLPAVALRLVIVLSLLSASIVADPPYDYEKPPKKVALVIGNANYIHLDSVPSSAVDGTVMAKSLAELGFDVEYYPDVPNVDTFQNVILQSFKAKIEPGAFVVFYFSGHGFSYRRDNYLAPTDLSLSVSSSTLSQHAIPADAVESFIADRSPGLILFIVDACRTSGGFVIDDGVATNPLDEEPGAPTGSERPVNTLVLYSTKLQWPSRGSSSTGVPSIFTGELQKYLTLRGQPFGSVFREVAADVLIGSKNDQHPVLYNFSPTDPYLSPTSLNHDQERELWQSALQSGEDIRIKKFLLVYSVSNFADAARKWLDDKEKELAKTISAVSPKAVDRAWETTSGPASVRRLALPLAFKRSLNEAKAATADLSDAELGVVSTAAAPNATEQLAASLANVQAHSTVVTTNALTLCPEPKACGVQGKRILAGTELEVNGLARDFAGRPYLSVVLKGSAQAQFFRLAAPQTGALLYLGQPVKEVFIEPRKESAAGLIDKVSLQAAVKELQDSGWTITRVSVSTGQVSRNTEQEAALEQAIASLQIANTKFVLQQSGIAQSQVTSVVESEDFARRGVRVRFFGRKQ